MKRPLRDLVTTVRQAAATWHRLSAAFATVAAWCTRLRASIIAFVTGRSCPPAAPAAGGSRGRNDSVPKPGERPLWPRLRRLASNFGFRRSQPADPTSRTPPNSPKESSSISAARAAFRRCWSSSTTTRRPGGPPERGCSRRSVGLCRKTSTKVASSGRFRCGARTNWNRSYKPASSKP